MTISALGREGGDDAWNVRGKLKYDNGGAFRATLSADYSDIDQDQIANKLIATTPAVFAGTYNCAIAGLLQSRHQPAEAARLPLPILPAIGGLTTLFNNPTVLASIPMPTRTTTVCPMMIGSLPTTSTPAMPMATIIRS